MRIFGGLVVVALCSTNLIAQESGTSARVAALQLAVEQQRLPVYSRGYSLVRESSSSRLVGAEAADSSALLMLLGSRARLAATKDVLDCGAGEWNCTLLGDGPVVAVSDRTDTAGRSIVSVHVFSREGDPLRAQGAILEIEVARAPGGWRAVRIARAVAGQTAPRHPPISPR